MSSPIARPGIMKLKPYSGGESVIAGTNRVIKLSSNEGAFGPSPQSTQAYEKVSDTLHRYPDGSALKLRLTIEKVHNIDHKLIVCGCGSDEIISLICKAYAGPGDEVLYSQFGFLMYPIAAMAVGATPVSAAETNLTTNVDSLLDSVTSRTKLLFLANPNNPTGTYIPKRELIRLRKNLPKNIILVIDAAYAEYVSKENYTE